MRNKQFIYILLLVLTLTSCAKRGSITGGDKDITPPVMISSTPKNFSKEFNKNQVKIYFDEYVKIKDIDKNLIISPPMKTAPTITPQGSASKYISIIINDTLKPNTTYSFNFGQSIIDNNEGNAYKNFKYVVSTGKEIDSLTLEGTIKDAYEKDIPHFVNVMLYEVDDNFKDSIIYKETPRYITNTLDSVNTFKIENIKAGKYKLIALKEKSPNYKFNPKTEKIGFYDKVISIPDKSIYELELFKEKLPTKFKRPSQASGNRVVIGYEGSIDNVKASATFKNSLLNTKLTQLQGKDSLQLWFKPIKNDSIDLSLENGEVKNKFWVKLRNQRNDTLKLSLKSDKTLHLKENLGVTLSTPLEKIDLTKIKLIRKDSSKVEFKTNYDEFNQKLDLIFEKQPEEKYAIELLPGAIEDYLGQKNDTLKSVFTTKALVDYGNLTLNLKNGKKSPIIVELTDEKGKVEYTQFADQPKTIEFLLLEPKKYFLRVIYDLNNNKKWDTGSYLESRQPEEVFHFPTEIIIRPNWDVNQDVDLEK